MTRAIQVAMRRPVITLLLAVLLLSGGATGAAYVYAHPAAGTASTAFPQSAAMEQRLGVRFSRLVVVGDGGLLQLSFVILDADRATAFEASLSRPPAIFSEDRPGGTARVSVMKQGHNLIPGQTYYLVYENTAGAVRPGGHATIVVRGMRLAHVPVLG